MGGIQFIIFPVAFKQVAQSRIILVFYQMHQLLNFILATIDITQAATVGFRNIHILLSRLEQLRNTSYLYKREVEQERGQLRHTDESLHV